MNAKMRLGVSQCLLGKHVRYDGQHKLDRAITETLGQYFDFVPVCPEVECGLPVPREAMNLVGTAQAPRLMTQRTGRDLTDQMLDWSRKRVTELEKEDLCGYIFKTRSPSCGIAKVKVYNERGRLSGRAPGIFARAFMAHFPLLPVEDEGRLHDPDWREHFIERIFTLKRYRDAVRPVPQLNNLVEFHARHKLLIRSHSSQQEREMDGLLANTGKKKAGTVAKAYEHLLFETLKLHPTPTEPA